MSTPKPRAARLPRRPSRAATTALARAPFVGALLRMALRAARARVMEMLAQHGFDDLNEAHLNVFNYPPPDGVRPGDLARRTGMTKQAMNYLLGELERMGYVERRTARGEERRLVYLTAKGWRVIEANLAVAQQLEREWTATLGQKRFDNLVDTLRRLAASEAAAEWRDEA